MLKREVIIFDFETNGFNGTSVLSLSAIKAQVLESGLKEVERFNRFYYRTPGEAENLSALQINNLYTENLDKFRKDVDYPEHYIDDITSFIEFCGDADHFVAHNVSFDKDFVGFETLISFCTFLEARKMNMGKNYKLSDLAKYYGIHVDEGNLHNSMYDVEILYQIIENMYMEKNENLLKFFTEKPMNKKEQKYIQVRFNSYLKSKNDTRERFLERQSRRPSKNEIVKLIEEMRFSSSEINVSQFLKEVNPLLIRLGFQELKAAGFNNYLKKFDILSTVDGQTVTNENSEKYGISSKDRKDQNGKDYQVILYNNLGKKTMKEYLIKYIMEQIS
ncbi:MAG: 3'-5' exonuclease [Fusobacteriaceae bacterium]